MSLVYVDEDPWLKEYQSCETLCSELSVRVESFWNDGSSDGGDATDIRLRLRQCDQQLSQLRTALFSDDPDRFITSDERERRERCLEALYDRARHLRTQFSSSKPAQSAAPDVNRGLLFGPSGNTTSRGQTDDNQLDPEIARQRQTQALEEQDRGLEALSKIISRQKNIAQSIDSEVTAQTEIVTTLADTIGRVGARTEGATRRTAALITRDNTCGYWVIAILLFIAIIIVAVIP